MRLSSSLEHALDHSAYSNIGADDHHDAPENIETSNTTLVVPGLLVGPANWDILLPDEATLASVVLRSVRTVQNGGAKAGTIVFASSQQFAATGMTFGGYGTIGTTAFNMVYTKAASAVNLSDKIYSSGGSDIALSQAYIFGGAGSRVLRLEFTNYNFTSRLLNVHAEVAILG